MPVSATSILPKNILATLRRSATPIELSPLVREVAALDPAAALTRLQAAEAGLSQAEAEERLEKHGPNTVTEEARHTRLRLFVHACLNPLVILLLVLATVAYLTGDLRAAIVMLLMVILGVVLRFVQEAKADNAAAKLKAMITVTATVVREGQPREIPLAHLVPGDVVQLAAGDMIPADLRVLSCKDLFVIQSSLTGESLPVEKFETREDDLHKPVAELRDICFLGTSVESGSATALVVETGFRTFLGSMAKSITAPPEPTSFDRGVTRFTWLMIWFMMVMVPLVFLINGLTKHNWSQAFFFALAVAVGMTPEMLPMIVTVCLSRGALSMSRKKVIVKRLHSIQNLGAMDVLCTDKTGTLTLDRVLLERHCDVVQHDDEEVLVFAYLNSHFQTGLKNVLDRAILHHREIHETFAIPHFEKVDEIPFDFARRVMSVVVRTPEGTHRLISKGAPEAIFGRCNRFELDGQIYPLDPLLIHDLQEEYDSLSADGFRVLAIAYDDLEPRAVYSRNDERDLILKGYVAFLDPPKETAAPAIAALKQHGISVKILTGDNELVSRKICAEVGLPTDSVLLGTQVAAMSDAQLAAAADNVTLFARLSPADKERIVRALQSKRHVVGFMGDGINDSPALRVADVGLSVDGAVDIAREAADVILLEKSLLVLEGGVLEGRKVFANILKYIRMGASSNFGNMFSVLGASVFLPFIPMAPLQILTNNLLYDFSQVPIPADNVDPEQITKPRPWDMGEITRFILFIGPCSSVFDYTTYLMMLFVFNCYLALQMPVPPELASRFAGVTDVNLCYAAALFQTGWFVESLLTQTLIIHVIRTRGIPFLRSWASWPLVVTTAVIMLVGMWLPSSPLGASLGFCAPAAALLALAGLDARLLPAPDPRGQDLVDPPRLGVGRVTLTRRERRKRLLPGGVGRRHGGFSHGRATRLPQRLARLLGNRRRDGFLRRGHPGTAWRRLLGHLGGFDLPCRVAHNQRRQDEGKTGARLQRLAASHGTGGTDRAIALLQSVRRPCRGQIVQGVLGRPRLRPDVHQGQAVAQGIERLVFLEGELLGVSGGVHSQRHHVGVEIHRVGVGIVRVAPKNPPRQKRVAHDRQRPHRVTHRPAHRAILAEAVPFTARIIFVEPDLDLLQVVAVQVVLQSHLGLGRHLMTRHTIVQHQHLRRHAHHPAHGVDHRAGTAAFDLRFSLGQASIALGALPAPQPARRQSAASHGDRDEGHGSQTQRGRTRPKSPFLHRTHPCTVRWPTFAYIGLRFQFSFRRSPRFLDGRNPERLAAFPGQES